MYQIEWGVAHSTRINTQLKLISDLKIVCDSLLITVIQNRALGALDVNFSYLFLFYNWKCYYRVSLTHVNNSCGTISDTLPIF